MKFAVVCLCLALPAFAQTQPSAEELVAATLPDSPSTTKASREAVSNVSAFRTLTDVPPPLVMEGPLRDKSHKVADRNFALLTLMGFCATVGDIESTQRGLGGGGREANPLVGSRPSRVKLYSIGMPAAGLVALWSYELKKVSPHSKRWMIPPVITGMIHGGAAIHNLTVN